MKDNVYSGYYDQKNWYTVRKNDEPFDHAPSLAVRNHSPDGFAWGYYGSGPAQLALAILLEETGNSELSETFYQDFKFKVIGGLSNEIPEEDGEPLWELSSNDIKESLHSLIQDKVHAIKEHKEPEDFYCGGYACEFQHKYEEWIKEIWT